MCCCFFLRSTCRSSIGYTSTKYVRNTAVLCFSLTSRVESNNRTYFLGDIKLGKLQPSTTTVGETVAFACTALKGADATFLWTKNGFVLRGNEERYSILGNKLTSVLTIEDVGQDDSGNFTCVASNPRSEDRTSATLVVRGDFRVHFSSFSHSNLSSF